MPRARSVCRTLRSIAVSRITPYASMKCAATAVASSTSVSSGLMMIRGEMRASSTNVAPVNAAPTAAANIQVDGAPGGRPASSPCHKDPLHATVRYIATASSMASVVTAGRAARSRAKAAARRMPRTGRAATAPAGGGSCRCGTGVWQRHAPLDDPALPDQSARSAHDRPPRWRPVDRRDTIRPHFDGTPFDTVLASMIRLTRPAVELRCA